MGNKRKKSRMCKCSLKAKSLCEVCEWNNFDDVAIEYYDLTKIIKITYAELYTIQLTTSTILQQITNFTFIGICHDIPEYCIPPLMLGIMASLNAFVNLPGMINENMELVNCLNIKYLFAVSAMANTRIIKEIEIHQIQVYLIELYQSNQRNDTVCKKSFAYAITTSGTTGIPKIVKVPHCCILPNIWDLKAILNMRKLDRVVQLTSFTFDPSIIEVFLAFSCGGTLIMVSNHLKQDTNRLLDIIYEHGVTFLQSTPSLLLCRWSSERLKRTIFNKDSSLRVCLLGGEPFPNLDALTKIVHAENKTRFFNVYGITEISCWASINEVFISDKNMNPMYLGEILAETIFQVKDEKGAFLKTGEGMLHIGSTSRICVIDNEAFDDITYTVFRDSGDIVTINGEGKIFYKARKNKLVKRFGNKVNLQKLVSAVQELSFIEYSYAHWDVDQHRLYLLLTTTKPTKEHTFLKTEILIYLQKLPAFYKPDGIYFIKHFKHTSNGKICQQFVIETCIKNNVVNKDCLYVQREVIEETLMKMWTNYVPYKDHGFIDSGGTSVDALQISVTISDAFNLEFPELIGMLLTNASFEECFCYINNCMHHISPSQPVDDSNSSCNKVALKTSVDYENVGIEVVNNVNNEGGPYFWQKCRGKLSGFLSQVNCMSKSTVNNISKIQVEKTFNLHKCVDSSPTMSRYSNNTMILTVGSHAGNVCTLEINQTEFKAYYIKLANRIEGSVLVLNNFKGVVGSYDGFLYCLDLKSGEIVWKFQTEDIIKCTAILCHQGERLFIGSYDRHVYCLSVEDGSCIWKMKVSDGSISATGCLHAQTNSVLFGTLNGTCLALDQHTGKVIWQQKLDSPIFVAPVVFSNGFAMFCSVAGVMCCFDIVHNEKVWTYTVNGNVFAYPIIQEDPVTKQENIIIASMNKNVYCFQFTDASKTKAPVLKHAFNFESPIYATPWYENDFLFVVCIDGTCQILRYSTGGVLARIKLAGETFSSPIFHNDTAFVGCRDNHLYVLKFT